MPERYRLAISASHSRQSISLNDLPNSESHLYRALSQRITRAQLLRSRCSVQGSQLIASRSPPARGASNSISATRWRHRVALRGSSGELAGRILADGNRLEHWDPAFEIPHWIPRVAHSALWPSNCAPILLWGFIAPLQSAIPKAPQRDRCLDNLRARGPRALCNLPSGRQVALRMPTAPEPRLCRTARTGCRKRNLLSLGVWSRRVVTLT